MIMWCIIKQFFSIDPQGYLFYIKMYVIGYLLPTFKQVVNQELYLLITTQYILCVYSIYGKKMYNFNLL